MNAASISTEITGTYAVVYTEDNRQRTWSGGMTYLEAKACLKEDSWMIPGNWAPRVLKQEVADRGNGARVR